MEVYRSVSFKPEELALLGRAVGTVAHGTVIVGRDGRSVSRYGKRALVVGIISTGTTVMDVRLIPLIALRDFSIKKESPFVYVYYDSGVRVEVEGLEEDEIKTILHNKSFIEAHPKDIGATVYYPNALEDYLTELFKKFRFKLGLKVLVDAMNTPAVLLFPRLNEHLGFEVELINDAMTSYLPPKPKEVFLHKLQKGDYDLGMRFRPDGVVELHEEKRVEFRSLGTMFEYLKKKSGGE